MVPDTGGSICRLATIGSTSIGFINLTSPALRPHPMGQPVLQALMRAVQEKRCRRWRYSRSLSSSLAGINLGMHAIATSRRNHNHERRRTARVYWFQSLFAIIILFLS